VVGALRGSRGRLGTSFGTQGGTWILAAIALVALLLLLPRIIHGGPSFFVQILIYGLSSGAIYALIALGYTMVYGIIELINFAHGDIFTLGAFISWYLIPVFGLAEGQTFGIVTILLLIVILVIVMLTLGGLNMLIELVAYRPLRNAPRLAPLITAVGMSFMIEGVMFLIRGPYNIHYPDLLPGNRIPIGPGASIGIKDIIVLTITAILVVGLTTFINGSKLGKAMRATAQDRDASQLMGINTNRTISATFFIGAVLAGAGGIIFGLYYNNFNFFLGFSAGLVAFTAAVFGGIGNIQGAALGAVLIGLIQAFSDGYGASEWTQPIIFAVLILVLTFRPTGLLGMQVPEK
jgi:branched-chain amino acid transport system permease protein